jgi:hypothetical protein
VPAKVQQLARAAFALQPNPNLSADPRSPDGISTPTHFLERERTKFLPRRCCSECQSPHRRCVLAVLIPTWAPAEGAETIAARYAAERACRTKLRRAIVDIVIHDRATFTSPHQYPDGIDYVFVSGTMAIDCGAMTERRPGVPQ